MPASRSRRCARIDAFRIDAGGVRGRHRQRRMAGADAASGVGRAGRARRRQAARSGSTAATMPRAGASPPPRSAISRSGCRVRWCVIVGMMANKDAARLPRQFRRPDPPHHRGADSRTATTRCRRTGWRTPRARSACAWRLQPASRRRCARLARLAYEVPPRILITGSLYLAGPRARRQRHAARRVGSSMRFAAIADVHGNYLALEAVIADIRAQGIDDIVNLGDMASGPLDARRTMDRADGARCRSRARQSRPLSDRPPAGEDGIVGPPGACAARRRAISTGCARCRRRSCFATRSSSATRRLQTTRSIGWRPCMPDGAVRMSSLDAIETGSRGNHAVADPLRSHPYRARGAAARRPSDRQSRQRRLARLSRHPSISARRARPARRMRAMRSWNSPMAHWRVTFRHVPYDHEAMAALARQQWPAGTRIGVGDRLDTLKTKRPAIRRPFQKSI